DRATLVEQQSEELIAHHGLEVGEGQTGSGVLAHALQQAETTLVGDALGHADIEESADGRLARTAACDVTCQLVDALSNEGAIDRVDAGAVARRRIGGFQANQSLE